MIANTVKRTNCWSGNHSNYYNLIQVHVLTCIILYLYSVYDYTCNTFNGQRFDLKLRCINNVHVQ